MGLGLITVDTNRLDAAARQVSDYADQYEAEYRALYKTVNELQASFDGKDYQAFREKVQGFEDDFQRMTKLMRDYADYLKKTAQTYRDTQQNIVGQASRLSTGN